MDSAKLNKKIESSNKKPTPMTATYDRENKFLEGTYGKNYKDVKLIEIDDL